MFDTMSVQVDIEGGRLTLDWLPSKRSSVADEFESFREVGHGLKAIRDHLAWHEKVFYVVVGLAAAGYLFIFHKVDGLEDTTARIDERLVQIDARMTRMEGLLERIGATTETTKTGMDRIQQTMASPAPRNVNTMSPEALDLLASLKNSGLAMTELNAESIPLIQKSFLGLPAEQANTIRSDCGKAFAAPNDFGAELVGLCTAIIAQ